MKTLLAYFLLSSLTGSPILALVIVLAVAYGGFGAVLGRLPDPTRPFRRWSRARELRAQLGMNPRNVNAATELGGLLCARAPQEAKSVLADVVERCPDLPLPMVHLGRAHLAMGDTAGGRALIERALQLKPDVGFGEPWIHLGDHLLRKGDAAGAVDAYERATKVHSSSAEAWYKLGRAHKTTGDAVAARNAWDTALSSTRHAPAFKARIDRPWRVRTWLAQRLG